MTLASGIPGRIVANGLRRSTNGWLLATLYVALVLPPALYHPLASFDEAWYAAVARNALANNDLWTFQYNGDIFWDKPPVALWATAFFFRVFGVGELAARAFAMSSGLATLLLVDRFASRRLNARYGLVAGCLLLCCHDWLRFCAKGQMDVPVTLFVAGNALFFWLGLNQPRWHWLAGVCLGLGIATKNQVGAFGAIACCAFCIATMDWRAFRQRQFWGSLVLAFCVAAPWFLQQYCEHGKAFVQSYVHINIADRQYGKRAGANADYWFYPRYLATRHPLLATGLIGGVVWWLVHLLNSRFRSERRAGWDDRFASFLALWIGLVFSACMKIGAVHFWYLIPIWPAAALLMTEALADLGTRWRSRHRFERWAPAALAGFALAQQIAYYLPPPKEPEMRAARQLAAAVRLATPVDEAVYLLQSFDRPRREIFIPSAHYYFDRVAIEVPDLTGALAALAHGRAVTIVGDRSRWESEWIACRAAHRLQGATLESIATAHDFVAMRIVCANVTAQR